MFCAKIALFLSETKRIISSSILLFLNLILVNFYLKYWLYNMTRESSFIVTLYHASQKNYIMRRTQLILVNISQLIKFELECPSNFFWMTKFLYFIDSFVLQRIAKFVDNLVGERILVNIVDSFWRINLEWNIAHFFVENDPLLWTETIRIVPFLIGNGWKL